MNDLRRFFWGTFLFGLGSACFDLDAVGRTFLELPRETPGLLTVVFAASIYGYPSVRASGWNSPPPGATENAWDNSTR